MERAKSYLKDPKFILMIVSILAVIVLIISHTKKIIIIYGNSMEPTIKSNTFALIKNTSINDIEKNDIICFKDNTGYVVHRVVELYTNEENEVIIKTKGDNNSNSDATLITKDNYIGELGISIWTNDIIFEVFGKVAPIAFGIILAMQYKIRKKIQERGRNNESNRHR